MKIRYLFRIIILSLLSLFPYLSYGQIMKNIEFKSTDLIKGSITKGSAAFDCLQLKNAGHQQKIGDPDLPVCYYTFYIPMSEKVVSVTFKSKKQAIISLSNILIPTQHPIPISWETNDTIFSMPNELIYESDNVYPPVQAHIINTDYLDGDLKLVTLEVYPIQYFPKSKKIIYSNQFDLILETTKDDNSDGRKIHPKKREKEIVNVLKSIVENPQTLNLDSISIAKSTTNSSSKVISKAAATTSWTVPFYEYVIVTSNALKASFTDIITWKRQKGYNAGVITIDEILADPAATGDAVSNLNDNAGKLRQYLMAGYVAGITKYALLGGDYTIIPIRYGSGYENPVNDPASQIPSDLYFSDFNGNWNADDDIYTGEEYSDNVDYASEIYVGRLLCNCTSDVAKWTRKQLKYEINPGNGNFAYLGRALFTEADQLQQGQQAELVKMNLPSFIKTNTVILAETPSSDADWPTDPTGSNVIKNINDNLYGLLSNFNHGSPIDYGTATHGCVIFGHDVHSNVVANDSLDMNDNYLYSARPELNNGFDNLTNYDFPAVFYSVSCDNAPFDDFGTPTGVRNLAESFTCTNNGGGLAFIGNTRSGWVSSSYLLYLNFLNNLTVSNNLGQVEALSKTNFINGDHHWLSLSHNLVGCPETPMWTDTPTLFNSASVSLSGTSLTVNTGATGGKICVTSAADGGLTYFQVIDNVSNYTFTNVPASYKVVITKTNYIPFIYSSDCYIQNETYNGITIFNANNVWAGSDVTTSKSSGPVTIQSGANVTINADGDTNLMNGFEIQLGGQFEVK